MQPYSFSTIDPHPVDWIWPGRLARGILTILQADPGMGKGLVAHSVAASLTRGDHLPGNQFSNPTPPPLPPQDVLFCTSEENKEALLARAIAAGADLDRLKGLPASEAQSLMETGKALRYVLENLELQIAAKPYALIVIDPLVGFLDSLGAACNRDARRALTALARIAERRNVAILAINHLTKNIARSALYRGSGPIAISAVARCILTIGVDPSDPQDRVLACVKNNLSAFPPSLRFTINPFRSQFANQVIESANLVWLSEVEITADQLSSRPNHEKSLSAEARAELLLDNLLQHGPVDQAVIVQRASSQGISLNALRNAKANLGVRSIKRFSAGGHTWDWALTAAGVIFDPGEPGGKT